MMESKNHLKIKEWALEDRPREKLLAKGLNALSDAELIAILIGSGSSKESAVDLSKKILKDHHNNLNNLGKSGIEELKSRYHGIGEAKAVTIVAAMELGRRRQAQEMPTLPVITTSHEVSMLMKPLLGDLPHEEFWVLMLNNSNKVVLRYNASKGGITSTVIDTRLIMKKALECYASTIIICHNHPSGTLKPSEADKQITAKLAEAGKLMDIALLDHVIITGNGYFSFADEGLL